MGKNSEKTEAKKEREIEVSIELEYPFEFGSRTVDKLDFRRGKAGDIKDFPGDLQMGHFVKLISRLTAEPVTVIDKLDLVDFTKAMDIIGDFFPDSRPISGSASES